MAYHFDGTNDYILSGANYGNTARLSISLWIRNNSADGNVNNDRILSLGGYSSGPGISLEFASSSNAKIIYWTNSSVGQGDGGAELVDDEWTHFAAVSHTNGYERSYLNGVEYYFEAASDRTYGTQPLSISTFLAGPGGNKSKVDIAEIAIWHRHLLSPQEVWKLSRGTLPSHIQPKRLKAYWDYRHNLRSLLGHDDLTITGTPAITGHPPMLDNLRLDMRWGNPAVVASSDTSIAIERAFHLHVPHTVDVDEYNHIRPIADIATNGWRTM